MGRWLNRLQRICACFLTTQCLFAGVTAAAAEAITKKATETVRSLDNCNHDGEVRIVIEDQAFAVPRTILRHVLPPERGANRKRLCEITEEIAAKSFSIHVRRTAVGSDNYNEWTRKLPWNFEIWMRRGFKPMFTRQLLELEKETHIAGPDVAGFKTVETNNGTYYDGAQSGLLASDGSGVVFRCGHVSVSEQGRGCGTLYAYDDTIVVGYSFYDSQFAPKDWRELDARARSFVESLRRRPTYP